MRLVRSSPLGNRWCAWYLCYKWYIEVLQVRWLHVGQGLSCWEWKRLRRLDGWRIYKRLGRLVSCIRCWLRLKGAGVCASSMDDSEVVVAGEFNVVVLDVVE